MEAAALVCVGHVYLTTATTGRGGYQGGLPFTRAEPVKYGYHVYPAGGAAAQDI